MENSELARLEQGAFVLDGAPRVQIEITQAAADHVAAWDVDQRVKALHEAGHAVAAAVLGIPVKAVDVQAREGGHTEVGLGDDNLPDTVTRTGVLDDMVMVLAAGEAERQIIGQGTLGSGDDLKQATRLAYQLLNGGLVDDAPFISIEGVPFGMHPNALLDDLGHAAISMLAESRERARVLVEGHRDDIISFATLLYARRRLSGGELDDALSAVARHAGAAPQTGGD